MARKRTSARPNIPQETIDRARQRAASGSAGIAAGAPARSTRPAKIPSAQAAKTVTMEDLAHEYSYVMLDLRNMALLAAALFAFLVVVSLVL